MNDILAAARALDDRIAGVLLGGAVGDALGVPYEFVAPPLRAPERPQMLGGGLGDYAPGEYSDDTQMAWCIADVAARMDLRGRDGLDEVAANFLRWQREGATDIGSQTSAVLNLARQQLPTTPRAGARPHAQTAGALRWAARQVHQRTGRSAGNGSLMRTAPVALAYLDDLGAMVDAARAVSDLTHFDPLAGDACVLWCCAIRSAVLGQVPLYGLQTGLQLIPQHRRAQWVEALQLASTLPTTAFRRNGYVVAALQAAWSACHHGDSYAAVVQGAVYAGDDTDTVACIAGSLAGAEYGRSAIREEWEAAVNGWPRMDASALARLGGEVARRSYADQ